ncbi:MULTISPECIES: hypothetical protein [unclassified Enterococcus]|uniref:hypothetical protein n=1 Tax=unclassified Enterococcus TaxID=2608891 RepID=UPI001F156FCA|nr:MULTISPECIES: hypothetical protein [unclassified Enterococcus]
MGEVNFFCGEWVYTEDESIWTINIDKYSIGISYDKHQFNGFFTGIKVDDELTIYCEDHQWSYILDKRDEERIFVIRSKLGSGTTSNVMGIELIKIK